MNKLYNSITFGRRLEDFPQWTEMLKRHKEKNLFENDNLVAPGLKWKDIKDDCANKPLHTVMNYVNQLWNKKRYVKDIINFRKADYWQTPYQFSRLGGDCEDYAIAKMFTLKELGIPNEMRLLIVDTKQGNHAVLAIDEDDNTWILDNFTNNIVEHKEYDCKLLVSLTEDRAFAHIIPKQQTAIA